MSRKFYFLNSRKEWQGSYHPFVIIVFALVGILDPDTLLWNNKLVDDGAQHPLKCIYARKKASEYQFLPSWFFWKNIKIFSINKYRWFSSKLKRPTSWEKMLKSVPKIPSFLQNVPTLYIIPSTNAINDFAMPGKFRLELQYIDSSKELQKSEYPIHITKNNTSEISFVITMEELPAVNGVLHKESYGLHKQLTLTNANEKLNVNRNSVFDFSTRFPYKPQYLQGKFKQINIIAENDYTNNYNRLILKLNDDSTVHPLDILSRAGSHLYDHETLNIDNSLIGIPMMNGGGHSLTVINGKNYRMFSIGESILIIDGLDRESIDSFKQNAEVIRVALAVLSGKFYGGICNYLISDSSDFTSIEGVWYEIERDSVFSNRRVMNLQFFREVFKDSLKDEKSELRSADRPFPQEIFSALCEQLANNENLLHVAELIVTGMGNRDTVQQGALYSVALEALTDQLSSTSSKDLKPIQDKKMAEEFVMELLATLKGYESFMPPESFEIFKRKIELLNSPTNQDKLTKTFSLYSINLEPEDITAIRNRNKYLHGKSPLNRKLNFDLLQISLRLHTIIVALLLKSVGYKGYIFNLHALALIEPEKSDEIENIVQDLMDRMESAKEEKDFELMEAIKSEALLYHSKMENSFDNLIRLI